MSNPMKEMCHICNNTKGEHRAGDLSCPIVSSSGIHSEYFHPKDKFTSKPEPVDQSRCVSTTAPTADMVNSPSHYADHYPIEVYEIIRAVLNEACEGLDAFDCYCLGSELKYRLRAGFKEPDKIEQDIKKAMWFNRARRGE